MCTLASKLNCLTTADFTQAGIGIGLVFAALLSAVARNPSLRGQLFSYAILGFAFVEAIGLVSAEDSMDVVRN